MKKQINYPKIQQFRNVVSTIRKQTMYIGDDELGKPMYKENAVQPILKFVGTVKLHGTNGGISFNHQQGLWAQSRNRIITTESDNAGFAFFVDSKKAVFSIMMGVLAEKFNIDLSLNTITIYGEWAGKGIQKNVAISELEKGFYIFGIKVTPFDEEVDSYWLNIPSGALHTPYSKIYDINFFPTFEINIDFNSPETITNKLISITEEVEKLCPIAKTFGIEGVGEGVVWTTEYKGTIHRFKVKGDKHSASKVRKLANVNVDKIASIDKFVEYAATQNRFNQALQEVFGIGNEIDVKKLGDVIRWVIGDVTKEEIDVLVENGLEPRDVNRSISKVVREMFFNHKT